MSIKFFSTYLLEILIAECAVLINFVVCKNSIMLFRETTQSKMNIILILIGRKILRKLSIPPAAIAQVLRA